MFTNLHKLPAGQHMYTIYLANKAERAADPIFFGVEEVDVTASAHATMKQIVTAADAELQDLYDMDAMEVIAVGDQSLGTFVWKAAGVE